VVPHLHEPGGQEFVDVQERSFVDENGSRGSRDGDSRRARLGPPTDRADGVPGRHLQEAANQVHRSTTMRYDRARQSLTVTPQVYIDTALVAGATR